MMRRNSRASALDTPLNSPLDFYGDPDDAVLSMSEDDELENKTNRKNKRRGQNRHWEAVKTFKTITEYKDSDIFKVEISRMNSKKTRSTKCADRETFQCKFARKRPWQDYFPCPIKYRVNFYSSLDKIIVEKCGGEHNHQKEPEALSRAIEKDYPYKWHIKSENVIYRCGQCEYKAPRETDLKRHVESIHGNFTYWCEQCDYKTPSKGDLNRHTESVHGKNIYSCDQCKYETTQKGHLKRHFESIHAYVTYPCDECEYKATRKGDLRRHFKSKHETHIFACDQCEYKATEKGTLIMHIESTHRTVTNPWDNYEYDSA